MKEYISKAFQDRIEISLANISKGTDDKFSVVSSSYRYEKFKCELCAHYPCLYSFKVKNHETSKIIEVGSECVKHFIGECDIDIVSALKKRVKSATRKMRKQIKKYYSDEEYKALSPEKKRELTIKLFMIYQTKEALEDGTKKTRLTKEDVEKILD